MWTRLFHQKWNPFSLRSKEGRFLSIVLFSKESKMNWVREIKRSIISLQELCLNICSLATSSDFKKYFFFNFRGIKVATNFFSIAWISDAVQMDFIPANHHEDQFWPQMTWRENCCKHNKRAGITRLRKVHLDLELII